ncbi:hypothetical protein [Bradyrhizobium sp. 23AC]
MCNVSQPALTRGVQKLEHELGGASLPRTSTHPRYGAGEGCVAYA